MKYLEPPCKPYTEEIRSIIQNFGVMNQYLISRCIDLGLISEIKRLKIVDKYLLELLDYKKETFNLANQLVTGTALLVGEGNLSFALSLSKVRHMDPRKLIATTFEVDLIWLK